MTGVLIHTFFFSLLKILNLQFDKDYEEEEVLKSLESNESTSEEFSEESIGDISYD